MVLECKKAVQAPLDHRDLVHYMIMSHRPPLYGHEIVCPSYALCYCELKNSMSLKKPGRVLIGMKPSHHGTAKDLVERLRCLTYPTSPLATICKFPRYENVIGRRISHPRLPELCTDLLE